MSCSLLFVCLLLGGTIRVLGFGFIIIRVANVSEMIEPVVSRHEAEVTANFVQAKSCGPIYRQDDMRLYIHSARRALS